MIKVCEPGGTAGPSQDPKSPRAGLDLLRMFLLEKAAYEIAYEAENRPGWLPIPLRDMADLLAGEWKLSDG